MASERTISELLRDRGYGHRPSCIAGKHEVFSFNTMEVVGVFAAHDALAAVGLAQ